MSETTLSTATKTSILIAISKGVTYADWWKTVSGLFPSYGTEGREEFVKTCQNVWRENSGKFSNLTGDK